MKRRDASTRPSSQSKPHPTSAMAAQSTTFVLPPDYTFTPGGLLIHKASFERLWKLFEQARNRDPDRHNLYIYNDYYGYAILDLVDKTLSSINTHVSKKQWLDAWRALDALSKFSDMCCSWLNVDDGDRVRATEGAHGALLITTIRGLEEAGQLNEETIPDLELSLMAMAHSAKTFSGDLDTCHHIVLKGYGKKLFGTRTDEEREQTKEARSKVFEAFVKGLSKQEREKKGYMVGSAQSDSSDDDEDDEDDEEEDDEEEDDEEEEEKAAKKNNASKVWFGKAKAIDAAREHSTFRSTTMWRKYKNYLAKCPQRPLRGPPVWDLTKWRAEEKQQFSLDNDPFGFDEDD
ncbi:hypothetical protein ACEPAI_9116 [Sanghuangporus weigelae]